MTQNGAATESAAERAAREAQNLDVMSALADANLDLLHKQFSRSGGYLMEADFIKFMVAHCPAIAQIYQESGCDPNPVRTVFYNIDADGDGKVFWEDLYSFAVDTARQRMQTIPADRIRGYSHSRSFPREDNVIRLKYLAHLDVVAISSRHFPLQIAEPRTLQTLYEFGAAELGGHDVLPICMENLPAVNGLVVFCSDMKLRCWILSDKLPTYKPMMCDTSITQLRPSNHMSPSTMLASDRLGQLSFLDYSRSLGEPSVKDVVKLHDPKQGGVADFCFCQSQEGKLVSAGYDGTLQLLDLSTRRTYGIGTNLPSTILRVSFLESHQAIICAASDNSLSSWATHTTQKPSTVFSDPSRPHIGRIVALDVVPNTPQVISCDNHGMMKIWDIRTYTCVQSLNTGEGISGESGDVANDFSHRNVSSAIYIESTREILCADPSSLTFHEYDKGADPTLADQQSSVVIRHNASANTILTMTASSLAIWSIAEGYIKTRFDSAKGRDLSCFCFDGKGRRIFAGALDGYAYSLAYHGGSMLQEHKMHSREVTAIEYSEEHRSLVTAGTDGYISVLAETTGSSKPPLTRLHVGGSIAAMTIQPKLGLIACGTTQGMLILVDFSHTRSPECEHKTCGPIKAVCFLDSYPLIATGHAKGEVCIYACRPILKPTCLVKFHITEMNGELDNLKKSDTILTGAMARRRSFNPVADAIGESDFAFTVGISQLRFHPDRHELVIGDTSGRLTIVSLCSLLQTYHIPKCSYPATLPFALPILPVAKKNSSRPNPLMPRFTSAVRAHLDEVLDIELVPHLGIFLTAGEDRRVRMWSMTCEEVGEFSEGRLPDEKVLRHQLATMKGPKRRGLSHHYKIAAIAAAKPPAKLSAYKLPESVSSRLTDIGAAESSASSSCRDLIAPSHLYCDHEVEKSASDEADQILSSPEDEASAKSTGPNSSTGWSTILNRRRQSATQISTAVITGLAEAGRVASADESGSGFTSGASMAKLSTSLSEGSNSMTLSPQTKAAGFRAKLKPSRFGLSKTENSVHLMPLLRFSAEGGRRGLDGMEGGDPAISSVQGDSDRETDHAAEKIVVSCEELVETPVRDGKAFANAADSAERPEQVEWGGANGIVQSTNPEIEIPAPSGAASSAARPAVVPPLLLTTLSPTRNSQDRPTTVLYDTPPSAPAQDFLERMDQSIRRVKDLQIAHREWERLNSARTARPNTARAGVAIAEATFSARRPTTGDPSEVAKLRLGGGLTTTSRPSTALVPLQQQQQQILASSPTASRSRVGIHETISPRVTSANVYVSKVRHDAPGFGRTSQPHRPVRPDARMVRIGLFEEELKKCLLRTKPPPDSEIMSLKWKCTS